MSWLVIVGEPVHRIDKNNLDWTVCGRYINGISKLGTSEEALEITCLACSYRRLGERDEEAGAEEQSK